MFERGNLDAAEAHGNDEVDAQSHHRRPAEVVVARNDEIIRQVENQVYNRATGRRSITCTDATAGTRTMRAYYTAINRNKKAQLSLTNPRDACEKFARFT